MSPPLPRLRFSSGSRFCGRATEAGWPGKFAFLLITVPPTSLPSSIRLTYFQENASRSSACTPSSSHGLVSLKFPAPSRLCLAVASARGRVPRGPLIAGPLSVLWVWAHIISREAFLCHHSPLGPSRTFVFSAPGNRLLLVSCPLTACPVKD